MTQAAPAPIDRAAAWKIVATVLAASGLLGVLLYRSTRAEAAYYRYVDEIAVAPASFVGQRLKVHGHVVEGSIQQARGTLEFWFKLEARAPRPRHGVLDVHYTGIVPDTFKSGSEVVAQGALSADGTRLEVVPDGIQAKCPSRYEGEVPKLSASRP